jgi:hypothetical protein
MPSSVFCKASKMHDVATLETSEWVCRLKHALVTNGAAPLQLLWNAAMLVVGKGHTSIAAHAVPKVNAQALTQSARIAIRAMEDGT